MVAGSQAASGISYVQTVLAESSLVGYWRLGEPSGTNAADSKGSNPGVYVASPTLAQPSLVVGGDSATLFNGTTQWVSIAGSAALQPLSITAECWAKPTSVTVLSHLMSFADGCFIVACSATSKAQAIYWNGSANRTVTGATTLVVGTIYQLAASFNNATKDLKIFVNGVEDGTGNFPAETIGWDATTTSFLAAGLGGAQPAAGTLDEAAVYNTALAAGTLLGHRAKGLSG